MSVLALRGIVFIVARISFCTAFSLIRPTSLYGFTRDSNVVTVVGLVSCGCEPFPTLVRFIQTSSTVREASNAHFAHVARIVTR